MGTPRVSEQNYSLGMAKLRFYDKDRGKTWVIGNIVATSIAPEVTFLDHFTVDNGTRKKDRSLITQKSIAINFTFDEITGTALRYFLLASASGASATATSGAVASGLNFILNPMEAGEINGSASLEFETAYGRDFTWSIPCASFKPDGSFDFNAEDWMTAKGILEVLQATDTKANQPYGWIIFAETWDYENEIG